MNIKKKLLLALLAAASMSAIAGPTADEVLSRSCSSTDQRGKDYCPYPFELVKSDPKFATMFKAFREQLNLDAISGPQSPMKPVQVWGAKYLASSVCESHNCGNNLYIFLYQPRTSRMVGMYRVIDGGGKERTSWLNIPLTDAEKDVLLTLMADATR